MNGNSRNNIYVSNNGQPMPDNFIFQTVDPSQDDDSDSDSASASFSTQEHGFQPSILSTGLKPGKKTKGRVKIKMEFIENKLRRYTTFSKRKTGIMKKAYELSTLTGTQVMLLVASETGHVYTFATRKLQPMITSESGKALIQTCLNSPDPALGTQSNSLEQRMNPSGFEETELSCAVGEEEQKVLETGKPVFPMGTHVIVQQQQAVSQQQQQQQQHQEQSPSLEQVIKAQREATTVPIKTIITPPRAVTSPPASSSSSSISHSTNGNINNTTTTSNNSISTMQFPLILSQGGTTISMLQPSGLAQAISIPQITQASSNKTTTTSVKPAALNHIVTSLKDQAASHSQTNPSGELNTPLPVSTPSLNIMQNMTPGIVMYHTPQGVVYATPTQNIHDRTIFNFSQPPAAISMTQADQLTGQQFITIPVPVGGTPLMQLANPPTSNNSTADDTGQDHPSPTKKLKK